MTKKDEKKLETMVKKLLKAGVEVKEGSFRGSLFIRVPGVQKIEEGRTLFDSEETGLLWPNSFRWELFRMSDQAVGILRGILSKSKGWIESKPVSFSEFCKKPEKLIELYSGSSKLRR